MARFLRWFAAIVAVAWVSAAVASCLEPTEIILELSTNAPCSVVSGNGVTIRIGTPGDVDSERAQRIDYAGCDGGNDGGAIGSLVLLPDDKVDQNVAITVTLGVGAPTPVCLPTTANPSPDQSQCIVARRQLGYVSHRTLHLPIELDTACAGVSCEPGLTCIAGACVGEGVTCDGGNCTGGVLPDAAAVLDATSVDVKVTDAVGVPDVSLDAVTLDACVTCPNSGTACIDFMTDKANCGACNVDCTGGSCVNGTCQLEPASTLKGSACLALYNNFVYVTRLAGSYGVFRVPTNGGSATSVMSTMPAQGIWSNGLDVYWGQNPGSGWQLGSSKSGTANEPSAINALTVNATQAAWFDFAKGTGWLALLSSPAVPTQIFTCAAGVEASVAVSAKYVHATCAVSTSAVCVHAIGGSTSCSPNSALTNPKGIVVDDPLSSAPNVYFTNAGSTIWTSDAALTSTSAFATGGSGLKGLAYDLGRLYAIGAQDIAKTQGGSFTSVVAVAYPASPCIAVDANAVYWVDSTGLYKHAK